MDIVILSNAVYVAELLTSKQRIARILASKLDHRVLYVEPGFELLSTARRRGMTGLWREQRHSRSAAYHVTDKLIVLPVPFQLPFANRWPFINELNQRIVLSGVRQALAQFQFQNPLLWMFDHRSYLIARWLRFSAVVYHRTDNFIDLCAGPTGSRETIRKHEEAAVRHAHLTLVSAVDLADLPKQLGARYEYIPHGVDMERFTDPELTRTRPPEYETLRGPIICFVGSIEKWVDIDLLACVATEQAQWNVCLVGPIAPEVSVLRLSECPNVILTGTVDSLRVPAYIAHADVCLIPFKVGPISNGANPLKLLEYFALGKPVVSTPVPEVSSHGPLVSIAENAHAFIEKIAYHLDHDDGLSGRRVTVAQSRSWESVLRRALSKIESDLFTEYSIDGLSEHHTRVL